MEKQNEQKPIIIQSDKEREKKEFNTSETIYIPEEDRKILEEYAKDSEYTRGLIK